MPEDRPTGALQCPPATRSARKSGKPPPGVSKQPPRTNHTPLSRPTRSSSARVSQPPPQNLLFSFNRLRQIAPMPHPRPPHPHSPAAALTPRPAEAPTHMSEHHLTRAGQARSRWNALVPKHFAFAISPFKSFPINNLTRISTDGTNRNDPRGRCGNVPPCRKGASRNGELPHVSPHPDAPALNRSSQWTRVALPPAAKEQAAARTFISVPNPNHPNNPNHPSGRCVNVPQPATGRYNTL